MNGFIITSHYEMEEEQAKIHLFGRLENGKSFEAIVTHNPYFFVKRQHKTLVKELITGTIENTTLKTLQDEDVIKITIKNPKEIPELRRIFEDKNIPCFEADIRFTQQYFTDNDILSSINITGEEQQGTKTDLIYINPTIIPAQNTSTPTLLSFDIETDKDAKKIYSIAIESGEHKEVLVVENEAFKIITPPHAHIVKDEKTLIEIFFSRIEELDPDILTGWHVIDFDFTVIAKRAKEYNIPFTIGRTNNEASIRIEHSFLRDSSMNIQGRIVLDGIQLLKSSFVKLDDYKLNTAAKHFLGETKTIQEDNRWQLIEEKYFKEPEAFIEYNLKDAELVTQILTKSKILELTIQRSLLTGLHMDNVKASIASFDSLYLRELRREGYVANTTRPLARDEGMGGFVMTSKPGLYKNILVLDFKSLYPSLMRTFNIDPLAYQGIEDEEKKYDKKEYIIAPNKAVFLNNDSILPKILTKLWDAREEAKKNKNELARYAIKILMNSMYGVLASPNSRFHNRQISNAITYFAQHFIKLTAQIIEEKGYEVIYGDTDSVFVNPKTNDENEAQQIGKTLEQDLNNFLATHIKETYHRESILELEFEKQFITFFMPKIRGSDTGAKKRYAGQIRDAKNGEVKMSFTGLEIVRRDWTELAKEFQMKLLDLIFEDKEVDTYIKRFVEDIENGKRDKLLIYRKALRKDLSSYTKTTPPHVKAARLLDNIDSNIIEYIMTLDGPQPLQKLTSPPDYKHYVEKQIRPIADSILELQDKTFDEVIQESKQKGLGDFF